MRHKSAQFFPVTLEEEQQIINLYQSGESMMDISNIVDRNPDTVVSRILHKNNIKLRTASEANRKYIINEDAFSNINTELKAWALGILCADGSNNIYKEGLFQLSLVKSDEPVVEKILRIISPDKPIKYDIRDKYCEGSAAIFTVQNMKISQDLHRHGCTNNKSKTLKFPLIDENLLLKQIC